MNPLANVLDFLTKLEERKISYRLEHNRHDSIMVLVATPGKRWEIEFFPNDKIEVEVFGKSSGITTATTSDLLARLEE